MQIVIDIPEEEYKCIQITGCIGNKTCISNAIYNGTPLPKGHGRLIDADAIKAEIEKQEKWLLQAGYTTYNVDIAFDAIKAVIAEREDKE